MRRTIVIRISLVAIVGVSLRLVGILRIVSTVSVVVFPTRTRGWHIGTIDWRAIRWRLLLAVVISGVLRSRNGVWSTVAGVLAGIPRALLGLIPSVARLAWSGVARVVPGRPGVLVPRRSGVLRSIAVSSGIGVPVPIVIAVRTVGAWLLSSIASVGVGRSLSLWLRLRLRLLRVVIAPVVRVLIVRHARGHRCAINRCSGITVVVIIVVSAVIPAASRTRSVARGLICLTSVTRLRISVWCARVITALLAICRRRCFGNIIVVVVIIVTVTVVSALIWSITAVFVVVLVFLTWPLVATALALVGVSLVASLIVVWGLVASWRVDAWSIVSWAWRRLRSSATSTIWLLKVNFKTSWGIFLTCPQGSPLLSPSLFPLLLLPYPLCWLVISPPPLPW